MTTTFFEHWRQVPEGTWRWKNFSPGEIACRGTGKLLVNDVALNRLQALRDRLGKPLIVRSGYRSPEHNRAIGGPKRLHTSRPAIQFDPKSGASLNAASLVWMKAQVIARTTPAR